MIRPYYLRTRQYIHTCCAFSPCAAISYFGISCNCCSMQTVFMYHVGAAGCTKATKTSSIHCESHYSSSSHGCKVVFCPDIQLYTCREVLRRSISARSAAANRALPATSFCKTPICRTPSLCLSPFRAIFVRRHKTTRNIYIIMDMYEVLFLSSSFFLSHTGIIPIVPTNPRPRFSASAQARCTKNIDAEYLKRHTFSWTYSSTYGTPCAPAKIYDTISA